jgi:hypothetical protein
MTDDTEYDDTDPLDPLRILAERLGETAQLLGLDLKQFKVHVTEPGHDLCEVWFAIDTAKMQQAVENATLEREFRAQLDDDERWRADAIGNAQQIIEADRKDDT